MILICPKCGTRFRIDPSALAGGGRMVRCSQCGQRWRAEPPPNPEVATAQPAPPAAKPVQGGATAAATASGKVPAVGWLALTLIVLLVAGAIVGRNEIVAAFPATAPLYARLGLPVTLPIGLEFRNLVSRRENEDGATVLVVSGEIHNAAGAERIIPPIRVSLIDAAGRELDFGLFDPPLRRLPPGATTRFEARLSDPPANAESFVVTFADRPQGG